MRDNLAEAVYRFKEVLELLNVDLSNKALQDTPERFIRHLYEQLTYNDDNLNSTFPLSGYDGIVVVKDVPISSLCEHHILPWFGRCHVGYIPEENLIGISKIPRLVRVASKGLTTQEEVTESISKALFEEFGYSNVIVVIEAIHSCMVFRGIRADGAKTLTSSVRGVFRGEKPFEPNAARQEFFNLIGIGI